MELSRSAGRALAERGKTRFGGQFLRQTKGKARRANFGSCPLGDKQMQSKKGKGKTELRFSHEVSLETFRENTVPFDLQHAAFLLTLCNRGKGPKWGHPKAQKDNSHWANEASCAQSEHLNNLTSQLTVSPRRNPDLRNTC